MLAVTGPAQVGTHKWPLTVDFRTLRTLAYWEPRLRLGTQINGPGV